MQKHKEKMLSKFDYLMKNSKNKTKEEIMRELFEEDNSFVEDSNQSKKLNMSKSRSSVQHSQNNDNETPKPEKKNGDFEFLTNVIPTSRPKEKNKEEKNEEIQEEKVINDKENNDIPKVDDNSPQNKQFIETKHINQLNNSLPNNVDNNNNK